MVRDVASRARDPYAGDLLRPAVALVERPPGRAVRSCRAQVSYFRMGVLAAGFHFPDRAAGYLGAVALPLHGGGGAPLLRLRVSADGVYRDLHVDRALGRRRPPPAHAARQERRGLTQDRP